MVTIEGIMDGCLEWRVRDSPSNIPKGAPPTGLRQAKVYMSSLFKSLRLKRAPVPVFGIVLVLPSMLRCCYDLHPMLRWNRRRAKQQMDSGRVGDANFQTVPTCDVTGGRKGLTRSGELGASAREASEVGPHWS